MRHRTKQTRNSFSLSDSRFQFAETIPCPILIYCHYILCVVDYSSHATWVYLLRDKKEACERVVQFCLMVKSQFETCVKKVHSDNGTEFTKLSYKTAFLTMECYVKPHVQIHPNKMVGPNGKTDTYSMLLEH